MVKVIDEDADPRRENDPLPIVVGPVIVRYSDPPTYLDLLEEAWALATPEERRRFLDQRRDEGSW